MSKSPQKLAARNGTISYSHGMEADVLLYTACSILVGTLPRFVPPFSHPLWSAGITHYTLQARLCARGTPPGPLLPPSWGRTTLCRQRPAGENLFGYAIASRTKEKPYRNVGLFSFVQPLGKQYPVRHRGREQLRRRPPPAAETGSRSRGSGRRGGAPRQGAPTDAGTATCQGPPSCVPAGQNGPVDRF